MKKIKAIQRISLGLMLAVADLAASDGFAQQTKRTDSTLAATDAYAAMLQADQARENEDWTGAIAGYRDALRQYRLLASSCPDWEPETVRYRITYCANQIKAIGRTTGKSVSEFAANSMPTSQPDGEAYRERYFALRQENQYLRQRLVEIESDPTGPQAAMKGTGEVEKLKKKNEQLQSQLAALTSVKSNTQTNELAARISKLNEERTALARVNELLKQELKKAKEERAALVRVNELLKQELEKTKGSAAATVDVRPAGAPEVLQKMRDGLAQERSGNFTAAQGIYEQILSARPSYAEALKARGRCLLQLGKFDEAAAVFRSVAIANRDDIQSRVLLGITYCSAGKYNTAVEVLTPLVVNDPSNARAQNAIGAALMGLGNMQAAKVALEKAVSLNPALADAHFNLAQVLLAAGPENADKARHHYRKAMTLGAQSDEALAKALGLL
jgi:tetratricopeptide (TPR) repeat protein